METRLLRLRDTATEEARSTAASRRAAEIRAAREAHRAEHARKKRELIDAVMDAVSMCASHRELVQTRLADLKQSFGTRLHQLLVGDAAASAELVESIAAVSALAPGTGVKNGHSHITATATATAPATAQRLFAPESGNVTELEAENEGDDPALDGLELQLGLGGEEDAEPVLARLSTMGGRPSMRPLTLENIMLDL